MPVLTTRPVAITKSAGWTATGGGSLSDDSDATYFESNTLFGAGFNMPLEALFSTAGVPANAVTNYVIGWARWAYPGGPPFPQMAMVMTVNDVPIASGLVTVSASPVSQGVCLFQGILNSQQLSSMKLYVYQIPSVTFNPFGGSTAPTPVAVRVYELFLFTYYAVAPVVAVTAPTGTITTTSAPAIAWTYTPGADGAVQSGYQVAVFSDDQYLAGGFSPDAVNPVWGSGAQFGAATTATPGPLPNDTYRAYVRAASSVNGQLLWSNWAFSGFVENITPPSAPTVSAAAVNAFARIDLDITGAGIATSVSDSYEIQRSSDGGVTWVSVRGDLGSYVQAIGGFRAWSDFESGNGESVIYRARTLSVNADGLSYLSAWSSSTSPVFWSSTLSWLKVPGKATLNKTFRIQDFGNDAYPILQGVAQGLGSTKATVQSGLRRSLPDGDLAVWVDTEANRTALQAILAERVVLVQPKPGMASWGSRYVSPAIVTAERIAPGGWLAERSISMPYTQVDMPSTTAYVASVGTTTWEEVIASYATWSAIGGAVTWGDIRQ